MKIGLYYVLGQDGKTPVATEDVMLWGRMMENIEARTVGKTRDEERDISISTVFLGIDHNFMGGAPLVFETMIFGGTHNERMWRYSTWDDALRGHKVACGIAGVAWKNFGKGSMTA